MPFISEDRCRTAISSLSTHLLFWTQLQIETLFKLINWLRQYDNYHYLSFILGYAIWSWAGHLTSQIVGKGFRNGHLVYCWLYIVVNQHLKGNLAVCIKIKIFLSLAWKYCTLKFILNTSIMCTKILTRVLLFIPACYLNIPPSTHTSYHGIWTCVKPKRKV